MSTPKPNRNNGPAFHLFDIRNIIGALLEIYGVVLLIAGVAPNILADRHDDAVGNRVDLYIGTDANWWVGVVLLGWPRSSSRGRTFVPCTSRRRRRTSSGSPTRLPVRFER